ncbi:GumC family protein, partial [Aquibium sp. A9E412]|uniref:GumC family protein n=1 Tax=Aquibium sp. A9E412 TaxID=2976767 RepID=UPI0025AFC142
PLEPEDDAPPPRRRTAAPPAAAAPAAAVAPADGGNAAWRPLIDPMAVVRGILRSKMLIAATTVAGAVLGVMVALSTPKMYYAATELLFDPRDLQLVERDLTRSGLPSDATLALVENQVQVIFSGTVLRESVERLGLADDPEFNGEAESGFADYLFNPRSLLSLLRSDDGADDAQRRWAYAVDSLADALDVERRGKTFVIVIGVMTEDPQKSARIADVVTDVYLETYGKLQANTATRANSELTSRLDELRADVEQAERAVAAYKAENDLVETQGRLITDDAIVRLNDQLSGARARVAELNARADSARGLDVNAVVTGALPEQVASPVMTELRASYASLQQQADSLEAQLGPRHPRLIALQAQLDGARRQIAQELRRIVESIQIELQRAVQLEQELATQLARLKVEKGDIDRDQVRLRELERTAATKRAVYEAFLLRARETGEQSGLNTANISVLSQAAPPLRPSGPSRAMIAIVGTMLGFFFGLGLGALRGVVVSLRREIAAPAPAAAPAAPRADAGRDVAPPHERAAPAMPAATPGGWAAPRADDGWDFSDGPAAASLAGGGRRMPAASAAPAAPAHGEQAHTATRRPPPPVWTRHEPHEEIFEDTPPADAASPDDDSQVDAIRDRLRAFRRDLDALATRRAHDDRA